MKTQVPVAAKKLPASAVASKKKVESSDSSDDESSESSDEDNVIFGFIAVISSVIYLEMYFWTAIF